jgi:2-iminobutanoate/2-iminopropanoate deaminase
MRIFYFKRELFMPIIKHNPENVFPQYPNYSHAVEVRGNQRLLFISGINGFFPDGKTMPKSFAKQAELVWEHIGSILTGANLDYENLISLRIYLASPIYAKENAAYLAKYLGIHEPAITIICCQLLDPDWKLEIEAIAATE